MSGQIMFRVPIVRENFPTGNGNFFPSCSRLVVTDFSEYDTIRYDSVYLTCSKKLTGSQLSLPHGINKK